MPPVVVLYNIKLLFTVFREIIASYCTCNIVFYLVLQEKSYTEYIMTLFACDKQLVIN